MKKSLNNHTVNLTRGLFCLLFFLIIAVTGFSQNAGISPTGATPNASAGLDVNYSDKGLLIPRVALAGIANSTPLNPIATPAAGMVIYNTATATDVTPSLYINDGTNWIAIIPKANTSGDMQYWNGTKWITIPTGQSGQRLQVNSSGVPVWAP